MKGALSVISVLLFAMPVAYSQSPPLDDDEVTSRWIKLQIMSKGVGDSDGVAHLTSHGISSEGATKLTAYVQQANAEFSIWAKGYRDRVCSQVESLRAGGQEALAQFFEKSQTTGAALRRGYLDTARELLPEADRDHLEHLLSGAMHGPKVSLATNIPNAVDLARTGALTVEAVLKRNKCENSEGARNETHE